MASCGMLGNDTHGDCVVADDLHSIMLWDKLDADPDQQNYTDAQALAFYQQASIALNGSAADQGLMILDFLKWRMKTPSPDVAQRKLVGFGTFDHLNHVAVKQLVVACKAVRLGVLLPITAQQQHAPGGVWTLVQKTGPGKPGSWGGHDVPIIGYDAMYLYVVTWGGVQAMTWDFFDYYIDETYGVIPTDMPAGFDMAGFIAELKSIGAYYGPDAPVPPPPPSPDPTPPPVFKDVDGIGVHYTDGTMQQIWPVVGQMYTGDIVSYTR